MYTVSRRNLASQQAVHSTEECLRHYSNDEPPPALSLSCRRRSMDCDRHLGNSLESLPSGIFASLTSLTEL